MCGTHANFAQKQQRKKNLSWRESQKWMRWRTLNGWNIKTVDYRMHYIYVYKMSQYKVREKRYSNEFYFQNGISSDLYWVFIFVTTLFMLSKLNCGDWICFFSVFFNDVSSNKQCWHTAFLYEHVTMISSSCSDGKTNIKHMIIHHLKCVVRRDKKKTEKSTKKNTAHNICDYFYAYKLRWK